MRLTDDTINKINNLFSYVICIKMFIGRGHLGSVVAEQTSPYSGRSRLESGGRELETNRSRLVSDAETNRSRFDSDTTVASDIMAYRPRFDSDERDSQVREHFAKTRRASLILLEAMSNDHFRNESDVTDRPRLVSDLSEFASPKSG